jgi:hypothetical protein
MPRRVSNPSHLTETAVTGLATDVPGKIGVARKMKSCWIRAVAESVVAVRLIAVLANHWQTLIRKHQKSGLISKSRQSP